MTPAPPLRKLGVSHETHRIPDRSRDDGAAVLGFARIGPAMMEEDVILALMFVAYLAGCLAAVLVVEKWEAK